MSERLVVSTPWAVEHMIILAIFSFVALISVVLRFWARRIQKLASELNDYLIIVGLVCVHDCRSPVLKSDVNQIVALGGVGFDIYGIRP
jgi:hypothetical protein